MSLQTSRSGRGVRVEICHQIPGRTRLRVPNLTRAPALKVPDLEERLAAALRAVDGVHRVRFNRACASLVLDHGADFVPTPDLLRDALRPILAPAAPTLALASPAVASRPTSVRNPRKVKARAVAGTRRKSVQRAPSCPICQIKLRAARWILTDVWNCWRDYLTQRLHGRLLASVSLLRL